MDINFYGAASCVTGSCHIMRANGKNILLDCGMFQGRDERERGNEDFPFNPKDIDYVLLSHAHIDHSGRIPLLFKKGFGGFVITTEATYDLCNIMLQDSGHIQEMELEWKNRKRERKGLDKLDPMYTVKDAADSLSLFRAYSYDRWIELFEGFRIRFRDAGHLLGSAIIEIIITEDGKEIKFVYTGDLGNVDIPLINDPTYIDYADYVIMETTYGDRVHKKVNNSFEELSYIIKDTMKKGGNVVIPSFAVGRTQEVLYTLNSYIEKNELKGINVYVDSPLAIESTKVFRKHTKNYDEEAKALLKSGDNPLEFTGLNFTKTAEESAKLNKIQSGMVVISASGMCEAGRIKHHLKHNLWRKECAIVFVGYQAEGTLGRKILEGAKTVKIFGEEIAVNASIYNIPGLSGHADRYGLLNWIMNFKTKPKEVLLAHGDEEASKSFKELIKSKGFNARIMNVGEKFSTREIFKESSQTKKEKIFRLLDSLGNIDDMDNKEIINKINEII
ncbi:MAG: MBL fold metallo-hydrolase RNA specificity domain-containing protein [Clostridiaceae bacterium]